jgi:hypothetical protein
MEIACFEAVQKKVFGQPLIVIALPKARISLELCSFWPACGPKTGFNEDFNAFGKVIVERGCPKFSFWTAPKRAISGFICRIVICLTISI